LSTDYSETMIQRRTILETLTLSDVLFIDVRTPLEFSNGAIPGAINIPLLSNEERVEIGTLYKQKGASIARERGLELVSPKFPSLYEEDTQYIPQETNVLSVYGYDIEIPKTTA